MVYIGLISDTHGLFDSPLKEFLSPVDTIWHAGDFGNIETVDAVRSSKPLIGVYGNCDDAQVRSDLPYTQVFTIEGMKVLMMHIGGYPGRYDYKASLLIEAHRPDIFVCGHSHILKVMNDKKRDMMLLNPGAAGTFGFHTIRTALRFKIDAGRMLDMEVWELNKKSRTI